MYSLGNFSINPQNGHEFILNLHLFLHTDYARTTHHWQILTLSFFLFLFFKFEDTLDRAWELLRSFPKDALNKIPAKLLKKYYQREMKMGSSERKGNGERHGESKQSSESKA